MDNRLVVLRTTFATEAEARAAAKRVIEQRVAACAHFTRIGSTYRWKGKIVTDDEWQLEAKAMPDDVDELWQALLDEHPYETPCVEVVGDVSVPARYHAWAKRATNRD